MLHTEQRPCIAKQLYKVKMASSQKMLSHLTFWIDEHGQIYIIQLCAISPVYSSSSEQLYLDVNNIGFRHIFLYAHAVPNKSEKLSVTVPMQYVNYNTNHLGKVYLRFIVPKLYK